MLQLQDFENKKIKEIIDLLRDQKSIDFEIYIPKQTKKYFSESLAIAIDYANLAYAGQLLKDVSYSFDYLKVMPEDHESILFTIKVRDIEKLADTLLQISYGYVNDPEDEEFIYAEFVDQFLDDVEKSKVIPACPYFIEVYKEFIAGVTE